MKKRLGFIGCGKMASAIIKGISDSYDGKIIGAEINTDIAQDAQSRLKIPVWTDNKALVIENDVIFIAVKPNQVTDILEEIKSELTEDKLIVSIAAGVSTGKIENILGRHRVVRIMPNTPALIKEGMFGICKGTYAFDEDISFVSSILTQVGKVVEVQEEQMDIVTAISGSGPAFFYKVIEDMARAGENLGLDYDKSLMLATQTALGSAKMIFNRGEIPVQTLIDNVATKGGCTFVGISVMNDENSKKLFNDVIEQTAIKANQLGR